MNYLLATPQKEIITKAYSGKFTHPQLSYLFDHTDTTSLKEVGPVLLSDTSVDITLLKEILEENSGLLITSTHSQQDILAQLRHNLFVYFKPDQIGIFRYYDPYIASYFFPSLNEQETVDWLGPIETIEWFNTDWRNKVNQPDQWQHHTNPAANNWQPNPEKLKSKPTFTQNQILALQDMQEEKFAYYWQQNPRKNLTGVNIDNAIYWVKEAIHIGCTQDNELETYLRIRAHSPSAPLPKNWESGDILQRLIDLEHHFQLIS